MGEIRDTRSAGMLYDFVKAVPPFSLLPDQELRDLASTLILQPFPKGQVILSPKGPPTEALYIIRSGGVKFFIPSRSEAKEELAIDIRGEGELFGFFSLLSNRPSPFSIVSEEDTLCLLINKKTFLRLMDSYSDFLLYFTMGPSKGFKPSDETPEGRIKIVPAPEPDILLFSARVGDIMQKRVVTCSEKETAVKAASLMTSRNVGCLLVKNESDEPVGILTDGDIRRKLVASGRLSDPPVGDIMTSPLISVSPEFFLFDAILLMIRKGIKYLPIMKDNALIGIISERDLMISQGNNPVAIIRKIQKSLTIGELAVIRGEINRSMNIMLERGGKAREICQLITQLNDHLAERIIELSIESLSENGGGLPPLPFAWLALGSEGRQEQTLSTDQDNAMVFNDSDPSTEEKARGYFLALGEAVVAGLESCGFPRCNGNMMASNPTWCQPLRVWKEYFNKWIFQRDLSAQDILVSSIFFDFRSIYGTDQLASDLRKYVLEAVPKSKVFLPHMALRSLELKTPLSFFNRFVLERSGKYKNHLNIKRHGLLPLVDPVRILALEQGISRNNTLERIDALAERKVFSASDAKDLHDAFSLMIIMRLQHHLDIMKKGEELHDYIKPSELSMIQRYNLKMSFKAIEKLRGQIEIRYGLTSLRKQ
ncbi:MAG: cyclic nucleotide-binding/CBS domain-containing protein [Desulfobacteraceae bacterium]|jgi:CBS domain-containing protein|nr:MAG: cyclic nucleotide-binding/CBS domain-containing protein [Desulfobacteraceae bacterium]